MKTDIEIAQEAQGLKITEIAKELGIPEESLTPYGYDKAKVDHRLLRKWADKPDGKLVLVTAISPTPLGEGKTTTSVGLADGLHKLGKKAMLTLREPSLGPAFGIKGGAAGGGYAQVIPMEDINLHFTGDFHAIGAANNLMAALIDNHIHQGNELRIDARRITWNRCVDMNDRQLRNIVIGLGKPADGMPREDHFDITVASEIMAIVCLSQSLSELKERLAKMVIGYNLDKEPVTCGDLQAQGALAALLKDVMNPNLVQTLEHTPAFVHGGPFANIAHGCNTLIATKLAMKLADYAITEAGFGSDLGAEKFIDIKCHQGGIKPNAVVLVATVRALIHHGGADKKQTYTDEQNLEMEKTGLANLRRHIDNIQNVYGLPVVVAINKFATDTEEELELIRKSCEEVGVRVALCEGWGKGGDGMTDLAKEVIDLCEKNQDKELQYVYNMEDSLKDKIKTIAQRVYRAKDVKFDAAATRELKKIEKMGYGNLPICMAKTQYSFSDNAKLINAPEDFTISIRDVKLSAGAGFVVAMSGTIMTMPGLPKHPASEKIDVDDEGKISGLF